MTLGSRKLLLTFRNVALVQKLFYSEIMISRGFSYRKLLGLKATAALLDYCEKREIGNQSKSYPEVGTLCVMDSGTDGKIDISKMGSCFNIQNLSVQISEKCWVISNDLTQVASRFFLCNKNWISYSQHSKYSSLLKLSDLPSVKLGKYLKFICEIFVSCLPYQIFHIFSIKIFE